MYVRKQGQWIVRMSNLVTLSCEWMISKSCPIDLLQKYEKKIWFNHESFMKNLGILWKVMASFLSQDHSCAKTWTSCLAASRRVTSTAYLSAPPVETKFLISTAILSVSFVGMIKRCVSFPIRVWSVSSGTDVKYQEGWCHVKSFRHLRLGE